MSSRLAELVTPLYRGTVAPSTASYLPTYQERSSGKPIPRQEEHETQREADIAKPSGVDVALFSLLEPVFRAHKGSLTLDQFVSAVVHRGQDSGKAREALAGSAVKLFRDVDFLDEGRVSWDAFSHHMITRKLNESNLSIALNVHADMAVSRVENIGANSGGVARITHIPEISRFAVMGVNTRALNLYPDEPGVFPELTLQSPDRCVVNDVCLVHETGQLAILGADHSVLLYDLVPMILLRTRVVLEENHFSLVAVGKRLFAGSVSGKITEIVDGEVTVHKGCHAAEIYSLMYFPALSSLGSASADGKVLLWDLNDVEACFESPSVSLRAHKQAAMYIAFNSRHTLLITGGLDKDALVWNPYVEREPVSRLQGHGYALCGVGTRQSQILTADVSGVVRIWDAKSFRSLFSISVGTSLSCLSVSKSTIYAGADTGKILCITSSSRSSSRALKCLAVAVSEHTQRVFAVTQSAVYVYTFDGRLRKRFPLSGCGTESHVTTLALTANGRAYITGHSDGSVIMFSAATGECFFLSSSSVQTGEISAIIASTSKVVIGTSTGLVRVLQVQQGKAEVRVEYFRHTDAVVSLLMSPDENMILSAGLDGGLSIFNLKELRQGVTVRPTEEPLIGLVAGASGNVRACDSTGTIVAYEIQDGRLVEISRRVASPQAQSVRGFGIVRGTEYVATMHNALLSPGGGDQHLPGVCRRILPFSDEYMLLHMQDGHVIVTEAHFKDLMFLGNALPLRKTAKSQDELGTDEIANKIAGKSIPVTLSAEKPITPFHVPRPKQLIPQIKSKTSTAFARLAATRTRAETVFRVTKLPEELAEASDRVAAALFEAGMDELQLFDCNPRLKR